MKRFAIGEWPWTTLMFVGNGTFRMTIGLYRPISICYMCVAWWCSGYRTLDSRLEDRGFDSRPFRCQVRILGKLFTRTHTRVTKQNELVPIKGRWCLMAGKVTVGLALHWPCVTGSINRSVGHSLRILQLSWKLIHSFLSYPATKQTIVQTDRQTAVKTISPPKVAEVEKILAVR